MAMVSRSTPARKGRPAQRRRTRRAIIAATMGLLSEGKSPTIDEIAAAADVARRTIYTHFPTLDQLILDATMGAIAGSEVEAEFAPDADVAGRVDAIVETLYRHADEWLPLGRRAVALTASSPRTDGPRRGHRRVDWVERAVEPIRGGLNDEQYDRLVSSLCIVLGWEAMIVLEDIRDHARQRQREVNAWAAQTLVRAMLEEADHAQSPAPTAG
jgi:AcrR family transcriptional regulator